MQEVKKMANMEKKDMREKMAEKKLSVAKRMGKMDELDEDHMKKGGKHYKPQDSFTSKDEMKEKMHMKAKSGKAPKSDYQN